MPAEPGTPLDLASHPRPQLARPGWRDLSGPWLFAYDDADIGRQQAWQHRADVFDRTVVVPFPPESPASGIGDSGFHPVLWYRRAFDAELEGSDRLLLHFDAVDHSARVWVNGHLAVAHEGGHTPFFADITDVLAPTGPQTVVVRAHDDPSDLEQPRGKQDWQLEPHAIWYPRTSGIWQPVWLERAPATRITSVRWTPDVDAALLRLDVRIERADDRPLRMRVDLSQHGTTLGTDVVSVSGSRASQQTLFPQTDMTLGRTDVLWSPETPNLIDARISLLGGGDSNDGGTDAASSGPVLDEVASYTAMRSVSAADGRVLLNGRPYFLRLVLDQAYWPQSHLAAPDDEALRREVEVVRELGFNGVRLHQKLADPTFLYWCDVLGLLVWAEMPAAYEFSTRATELVTREWMEAIDRDYSHPCVVAWVPVNESWGVPALERSAQQRDLVRALYHLTKALDPTRLVVGNDGWEQVVTDLITIHDYTGDPNVLRDRYGSKAAVGHTLRQTEPGYRKLLLAGLERGQRPVMVTEFGGISYRAGADESWGGYGAVATATEFLKRYRLLVTELLDSPALAGFCYTQLADTGQEKNGLLTEDRQPKLDPATVRRITRRPAAAVPADSIGSFEYGDYPAKIMDLPAVRPAESSGG